MIQACQRSQNREHTAIVLQRHEARHFDPLAIYPPVPIREKRGDHRTNVIRHARAAERSHFCNTLVDFGIVQDHSATESVWIAPGATTLAVIRRGPSSFAI